MANYRRVISKFRKFPLIVRGTVLFIACLVVTWSLISTTRVAEPLEKNEREEMMAIINSPKFQLQRNILSRLLNDAKQTIGRLTCEQLLLKQKTGQVVDTQISANGGWCKHASSPDSIDHKFDEGFAAMLSSLLRGKTVGSFGDGPGAYKKRLDELQQVKGYTAYDGAPYCEEVTGGVVKFLDLTAPQFGLPVFDWVVSVEVGEHIAARYEDIYLDNLVRHCREGLVLSWAVPGQIGLSHVNNKPLEDVIAQMEKRGFHIDKAAGEPLRNAAQFPWLKGNIHVYYRTNLTSFDEESAQFSMNENICKLDFGKETIKTFKPE